MTVDFNFNFWHLIIFVLNFALAVGGIVAARHRATYQALDRIKENFQFEIAELRKTSDEKTGRLQERMAMVETALKDSIGHNDLAAIHRRIDALQQSLGRMEGLMQGIADRKRE